MFNLDQSLVFVHIVKAGSLTAAAKVVGMPVSTVSDHLMGLEDALGVSLLTRTTRKIALTEAGAAFYEKAEAAVALMEAACEEASQMLATGVLRITAPAEFATEQLAQAVREYRQTYPRVRVEIDSTNRVVDLVGERFDLAIRGGKLKDSTLRAKRIGRGDQYLVASPAYLQRAASLSHPKDLPNHDAITVTRPNVNTSESAWMLRTAAGQTARIKPTLIAGATSFGVVIHMVKLGLGIALLPAHLVRADIAAKTLVHVLPEWTTGDMPLHLVYSRQSTLSSKVSAMIPILERAFHSVMDDGNG